MKLRELLRVAIASSGSGASPPGPVCCRRRRPVCCRHAPQQPKGSGVGGVIQIGQRMRQFGPCPGAPALDGALRNAQQPRRFRRPSSPACRPRRRRRVARGAAASAPVRPRWRYRPRASDRRPGSGVRRAVGVAKLVAAQSIQAGIDHDAVQPAVTERRGGTAAAQRCAKASRPAARRRRPRGCGWSAGPAGRAGVVAVEQFLERVAVAGDMRGQQLRIGPGRRPMLLPETPHSRTLCTAGGGSRHFLPRALRVQRRSVPARCRL